MGSKNETFLAHSPCRGSSALNQAISFHMCAQAPLACFTIFNTNYIHVFCSTTCYFFNEKATFHDRLILARIK